MDDHHKRPGHSTREMARKRQKSRIILVLVIVGGVIFILLLLNNSKALGIGGVGFLGLLFLIWFLMEFVVVKSKRMIKNERRAVRGAKAEEEIGSLLDKLDEGYWILHDVPSPYGNIDHIVLGQKSGVFLIETKGHGGRVTVTNGQLLVNGKEPEKNFIAQALKNTYWLKEEIRKAIGVDVWVAPIVVFTNAFVEHTPPVKGVTIINKNYLVRVLQRPYPKATDPSIWEYRERIQNALHVSSNASS